MRTFIIYLLQITKDKNYYQIDIFSLDEDEETGSELEDDMEDEVAVSDEVEPSDEAEEEDDEFVVSSDEPVSPADEPASLADGSFEL